jgi:F-type H+-transporting ATPase subunit delta
MAELATIARPYAEALFRVALPAKLNAWADLLSEMAQVAAVPDFQDMAHDPRVPRQVVIETFRGEKLHRHAGRQRASCAAARNRTPVP